MPCAAGELRQLSTQTPVATPGHLYRGGCGGRLHGICGEVAVEGEGEEMHRICHACLSSKQSSTAAVGKRKAQDAGGILKRTDTGRGKKADRTAPRTRLTLAQKMEVLADLDKKATQETVADKFKCGVRTIQSIKQKREAIVREAALAKGSQKSNRRGDFPDVDAIVLDLFGKARAGKIPVSRHVLQAFGRSAKATLLEAPTTSAALKSKLEMFRAGEKWCRNFVQRHNLKIKVLHGEAGSVNAELMKEGMEKIREECKKYPPSRIFNVDETGILWKLMPRRTYLSTKEGRKTARGTKGMKFKDRISAFMCANADGTAKVDMAIIGKLKNPRCFRARGCPLKYFAQTDAWSDSAIFKSWWQQVFLPFIRRLTPLPVLLLMDGCSSHDDLEDDRGQVTVMTYPPNCTSVHQPMDMGIIYATKLLYRRELLNVKVSTMEVAETLRSQAKDRKIARGMAGLAEGHQPHVLDAADLLKRAWEQVTEKTIARCWVKAKTLPKEMEDALTAAHGKQRSKAEDPAVKGLEMTLNTMSLRVHEAQQQGTSIGDTEIVDLLANLDITPGETAAKTSLRAAQRWASIEDQEDVIEVQQLDHAESVAASLKGLALEGDNSSESQDEEDDDENAADGNVGGGAAEPPPSYAELSQYFVPLESYAAASGLDKAGYLLQRARMLMIEAHASKPSRQTDVRAYFDA